MEFIRGEVGHARHVWVHSGHGLDELEPRPKKWKEAAAGLNVVLQKGRGLWNGILVGLRNDASGSATNDATIAA
jgi:hypothetical protein